MKKKQAKQLVWQLTEGIDSLDGEIWEIYYRVPQEDFKFKERLWRWEVVLEFKGKLIFRNDIEQIERNMVCEGVTNKGKGKKIRYMRHKFPYKIDWEKKEIVIW